METTIEKRPLEKRLEREGFRKVGEFVRDGLFPIDQLDVPNPYVRGRLDGDSLNLPGVELRLVDKAELDPNHNAKERYVIYIK